MKKLVLLFVTLLMPLAVSGASETPLEYLELSETFYQKRARELVDKLPKKDLQVLQKYLLLIQSAATISDRDLWQKEEDKAATVSLAVIKSFIATCCTEEYGPYYFWIYIQEHMNCKMRFALGLYTANAVLLSCEKEMMEKHPLVLVGATKFCREAIKQHSTLSYKRAYIGEILVFVKHLLSYIAEEMKPARLDVASDEHSVTSAMLRLQLKDDVTPSSGALSVSVSPAPPSRSLKSYAERTGSRATLRSPIPTPNRADRAMFAAQVRVSAQA